VTVQGGYQRPANPAPVSGPGRLSKRTDGGPSQPVRPISGLPYGENQELNTTQGMAPMSGTGAGQQSVAPDVSLGDMSPNLTDPSNQPGTSVFDGMGFGPGAGPEGLATPEVTGAPQFRLMNALPTLLRAAESPDVTPEFRRMVALIRSAALG
jgi:hypothetical protein